MTDIIQIKREGTGAYVKTHTAAVEGLEEFVTDRIPSGGSGGTIPGVATPSANGLMSKEDKTKLDGIESGAQKNPGMATTSQAGLMSATDKQIINVMGTIDFEKVGEV